MTDSTAARARLLELVKDKAIVAGLRFAPRSIVRSRARTVHRPKSRRG